MTATNENGNICHILPCSIDEDLTAHTAQYFHPTPLSKNEAEKDPEKNDDTTIMAAQFRGRGLLCAVDNDVDEVDAPKQYSDNQSKLPDGMRGVALSPFPSHITSGSNGENSRSLKVVESFSQIYSWQHEHDIQKIKTARCEGGNDKVGLRAVLGWCELAHAVS